MSPSLLVNNCFSHFIKIYIEANQSALFKLPPTHFNIFLCLHLFIFSLSKKKSLLTGASALPPLCPLIPPTSVPRTNSLHYWEAPSHCLSKNMPLQGTLLLHLRPLPCYLFFHLPSVYFISEKNNNNKRKNIKKRTLCLSLKLLLKEILLSHSLTPCRPGSHCPMEKVLSKVISDRFSFCRD